MRGTDQPHVVAGGLELADGRLDVVQERAVGVLALRLVVQPHPDDPRAERRDGVATGVGLIDRGTQHLVGLCQLAEVHQRLTGFHQQLDGERVTVGERRGRAPEQVVGRRQVAAVERTAPRRLRYDAARRPRVTTSSSCTPSSERISYACSRWNPRISSYSRMRSPAADSTQSTNATWSSARVRFSKAAVGGVADQRVQELERLLADQRALVRADELLDRERLQARGDLGLHRRRHQRLDRAAIEDLADHGAPLDHGTFRLSEAIQTSGQQRRDGRRDLDVRAGSVVTHRPPSWRIAPWSISICSICSR